MRKYLVIQLARFGDLVQTKRLIRSLAEEGAQVHLCLDHSLTSLAGLVYPECVLHPITAHASGLTASEAAVRILRENRSVFSALQRESFDRVYNLNFSGLNFRLAALFDPDITVGYSTKDGQDRISPWPEMAMRWSRDRRVGLNLVDFWAHYADSPIAPEDVNPPAVSGGGGIGVVLAGRESRRSLPVEVLARVVATRHARQHKDIFLLGSSAEAPAAKGLMRQLSSRVNSHVTDLAGKTDWKELHDIVKGLDVLLTPDTGTMHLAAHLGTPVEAFFLSSAWCFETGPYGSGHSVYQAIQECSPCLETQPCPYRVRCGEPFQGDQFLRYLSTQREEHRPEALLHFTGNFDDVGMTYVPTTGDDPDAIRRSRFRAFVSPHMGVLSLPFEGQEAHSLALSLYQEKDWTCSMKTSC